MRSFLSNLIMPLPLFWLLIILATVFAVSGRKKIFGTLMILSALWLLLISTSFVPNLLVAKLENQYPIYALHHEHGDSKPTIQPGSTIGVHILVLGGGYVNDTRFPVNNRLSEAALVRLTEGIRLHRQISGSILITSGWSGKRESFPQAKILAQTALLLGADSTRMKKQVLPRNTWMEATEYKRLFGDSTQLILVTSAVHMSRAVYLFQKAGLDPIPAPTNHMVKIGDKLSPWFWLPSSNNISKMERAIYEYAGLFWFKLGGSQLTNKNP